MRITTESTRTSWAVGHMTELFTSLTDIKFKRTENETQSEVSDPFYPLKIVFISMDLMTVDRSGCIQLGENLQPSQESRGKEPLFCSDLRSVRCSLEGR